MLKFFTKVVFSTAFMFGFSVVLFGSAPAFAQITSVNVTSPDTTYVAGNVTIEWETTPSGDPEDVNIYYCRGSGCILGPGSNVTLISADETNDGIFTGRDSSFVSNGEDYQIYVSSANSQVNGGFSNAFEVYNFDYSDGEGDYSTYVGINNTSPIQTSGTINLSAYANANVVGRSGYAWTQIAGEGDLTFDATGATSTDVTASIDGTYTIRFTATDEAGNTAYDEVTLIRDTTAPTASDDVQTGVYYQSATVTLNCDDTPGVGCDSIYYTTDGTDPSTNDSSVVDGGDFTISTEGTYTIKYIAVDDIGNQSSIVEASNTVRIWDDRYVEIDGSSPIYMNSSETISASTFDGPDFGVTSTQRSQEAGPGTLSFSATGSASTDVTASEDGVYTVRYTVVSDEEGEEFDEVNVYRDTTDPSTEDNVPSGRQTSDVTVTFTCSDTGDGWSGCERVYYTTDGTDPIIGSSLFVDANDGRQQTFTDEGTYTIKYRAIDQAGNIEATQTASNSLQIDKTDPNVSIDTYNTTDTPYMTGDPLNTDFVIYAYSTVSDDISGVDTCSWSVSSGDNPEINQGGGDISPCSEMVFDVDRSGDYIIRLTVTDNAGNSDYAEFALLWDNGIPTIENINMTEESYDTVAIAGLANNLDNDNYNVAIDGAALTDITEVIWNRTNDRSTGTQLSLMDSINGMQFSGSIDVSGLSNGTYTLYFWAKNEVGTWSEPSIQSFNKIVDNTPPSFVASTPNNGATHVSVSAGQATVTFDQDISCVSGCEGLSIKRVSDMQTITNTDDVSIDTGNTNTLVVEYEELGYDTDYVLTIPAGSIADDNSNGIATDINIYFSTQVGTAPNIEGLGVTNTQATETTLFFGTDVNFNDLSDAEYRYAETAYSGGRTSFDQSGVNFSYDSDTNRGYQTLTNLQTNTKYYYQVMFTHQGETVVSVPMVFTTSTADTGIEVHRIDRVMHDNEVLPNNTYANGYHFRFYMTLNAMEERNLQFKLNNRSRVDGETMQVANNTKVGVSIEGIHNHTGADVTLSSDAYTNIDDVDGMDADPSKGGRQLYIDVFYKIPTDAEGVYSTSYGIRSEEIGIE